MDLNSFNTPLSTFQQFQPLIGRRRRRALERALEGNLWKPKDPWNNPIDISSIDINSTFIDYECDGFVTDEIIESLCTKIRNMPNLGAIHIRNADINDNDFRLLCSETIPREISLDFRYNLITDNGIYFLRDIILNSGIKNFDQMRINLLDNEIEKNGLLEIYKLKYKYNIDIYTVIDNGYDDDRCREYLDALESFLPFCCYNNNNNTPHNKFYNNSGPGLLRNIFEFLI